MSLNTFTSKPLSIHLQGAPHTYPIHIQPGGLPFLGQLLLQTGLPQGQNCFIVTDEGVPHLYIQQAEQSLTSAGFHSTTHTVLQGEMAKSLPVLEQLYRAALEQGMTRHGIFIALGGGIPGDLTGFLASSFYRGAHFVQIPTTLLAQVDSSVGGKVAINFGEVKNCVGAFKQPDLVCIDPNTLQTLSPRELRAGLAELFKYALIEFSALAVEESTLPASSPLGGPWLLDVLETHGSQWLDVLPFLIQRACEIKAAVVMRDEKEQFPLLDERGRVCLNLGHTFGHAYESVLGYNTLLHGEAVAVGTLCAVIAQRSLLGDAAVARILTLMDTLQLIPYEALRALTALPELEALLAVMTKDKKNRDVQHVRLILPVLPLGKVQVVERPTSDILPWLSSAHAYLIERMNATKC
jgi:3-dehydroquinate synthase